jgi:hypothetical protein
MHKGFFIIFIVLYHAAFCQAEDRQLLFLTNFYVNQQNWTELEKLESKLVNTKQADILALLGKAYYYQNNLTKAEKFYRQSYLVDKSKDVDLEYFLALYLQGHLQEANLLRDQMSTLNLQYANIHYPNKTMSYLSLESGVKQIKETEIGENMFYGSLMAGVNVSPQASLDLGFSHVNQRINQGQVQQNEAHIGSQINVKNYFSLLPALHYAKTTFNGLSVANSYAGTSTNYLASLSLYKRFYNLSIMPQVGYILGETNTTFNQTNTLDNFNQNSKQKALQLGLTLSYKLKLSNHFYWQLTPSYYYINQNNSRQIIDGLDETNSSETTTGKAIDINSTFYYKKFTVAFNYLTKDDVLLATNQSKFFYNFPGRLNYNLSTTLGYAISPKFDLYLTFQKEQNIRQFDQQTLNFNNYFLKLSYKF